MSVKYEFRITELLAALARLEEAAKSASLMATTIGIGQKDPFDQIKSSPPQTHLQFSSSRIIEEAVRALQSANGGIFAQAVESPSQRLAKLGDKLSMEGLLNSKSLTLAAAQSFNTSSTDIVAKFAGFQTQNSKLINERLAEIAKLNPPNSARVVDVGVFGEESSVPNIQFVSGVTAKVLSRILTDPSEMLRLSPEKFEELIMDRFHAMGYEVEQVGPTNRADGGCDIIFSPRKGIPFLGAMQVKHHERFDLKVGSAVIQRMQGLLDHHRKHFTMGMVVTNTSFTSEAKWIASDAGLYLRLRDGDDVLRWVKGVFDDEAEEREVPDSIQLTSRLKLPVRRRRKH